MLMCSRCRERQRYTKTYANLYDPVRSFGICAYMCTNNAQCGDPYKTCQSTGCGGTSCAWISGTIPCHSNPCQNGGICSHYQWGFTCSNCNTGWTGTTCSVNINECASGPCNNGVCNDHLASYTCTCWAGYAGTYCNSDFNECASNPCKNGATCNNLVNHYTCTCSPGYAGTNCESDVNECNSNPCKNGAACNNLMNHYTCTCSTGFSGTNCEINDNECISNPCQNGATCVDSVNSYSCQCAQGTNGVHCENNPDECESDPCKHVSTCIDNINSYTCQCVTGYAGSQCETNINECASNPCQNNGTCTDLLNGYSCAFIIGSYIGTNCQQELDECGSSPCNNNGTCTNANPYGFSCSCPEWYSGNQCQYQMTNYCADTPCENNGTCDNFDSYYTCTCATGFSSAQCQVNIDDCASDPCNAQEECVDKVNDYDCIDLCEPNPCSNEGECEQNALNSSYTCNCEEGYTGKTCDDKIDPCHSGPCLNGGTCVSTDDNFQCSCLSNYTGTTCENERETCTNTTCQNNGTCTETSTGVSCNCIEAYTGYYCQTIILSCHTEDYTDIGVTASCYKFHTESSNITTAKNTCNNEDASLASILSADEQNAVYNRTSGLNESAYWWISLTDENNERGTSRLDWEWMDGSSYTWHYWDSFGLGGGHLDEPSEDPQGTDDYVLIGPVTRSGHWLAADESYDMKFICKAAKSPPATTTTADLNFQHGLTGKNCTWNATEMDKKIKDFLVSELSNVSSMESCMGKCADDATCLSMQYKSSKNDCQLNYVTRASVTSNNYETKSGWKYRDYTCTGAGRTFQHITTDKSCTWNNAVEKRRMDSDVEISSTSNKTLVSCRNMCEEESNCKSIAYKANNDKCKLYTESRTSASTKVESKRNFVYYDFSCSEDKRKRGAIHINKKDRFESQVVANIHQTNPVILHAGRSRSSCINAKRVSRQRTGPNKYCATLYFAPVPCAKAKMICAVNKSNVLLVNTTTDHKDLAVSLIKKSGVFQTCTSDNIHSMNDQSQEDSTSLDMDHAGLENKCIVYSPFQKKQNFSLLSCDMQFPILCLSWIW